jgi:hypothetical protein
MHGPSRRIIAKPIELPAAPPSIQPVEPDPTPKLPIAANEPEPARPT